MRKGNVLPIALIAFAIVGFLFMVDYSISGGKWPWSTENINTATQTTNLAANINSATNTTTDPTADWKTYKNTEVGYSIQYPSAWLTSSCPDSTTAYFGTERVRCQTEGSGDMFIVNQLDANFDFARTKTELKSSMVAPAETTITVGGQQATRITGIVRKDDSFMTGGGEYKDDIFILRNNAYVHIGYFILSGEKILTTEFSNFLTSFTFTK